MDAEKLEYFRNILLEEMKALRGEADKTVTEMTADASNFPDPTDRASQESDRNFELRIRDRERKLINKIKDYKELVDALYNQGIEGKMASMKAQMEEYNFFGSSSFPVDKMIFNSRQHWFIMKTL